MKILAVDDDPQFLELLNETLCAIGYTDIVMAMSANQAVNEIQQSARPFDCFLLDVQMPETDGITLCRAIRNEALYRATPILMITAMSQKRYIDDAFAVGATDYINKPIEAGELRARLAVFQKYLTKSRENAELMRQLQDLSGRASVAVAFDDPSALEEVGGMISYLALENYLLKLGNLRMFMCGALGFHVENAPAYYAQLTQQEFLDVMAETAEAIRKGLRGRCTFLSYAGRGDFVGIVPKTPGIDPDNLEIEIVSHLGGGNQSWCDLGVSAPALRTGATMHQPLVTGKPPTDVLLAAIESARTRQICQPWAGFFRKAV